ncbi:DNA uptake lipoprotein [Paenibacillus thiaminolyticus]|uniref:DNA uptake lipoprotein n=1 Tax=Paenibacillus thiaminolyticus TaxID=49283 RepID=A0AAP9J0V3_PANTH|nr:DNA uptake lipoprotein [Paenibacillus thiaminolyticus]MCY9538438.1 DNA uptake lipoprotein [Paenibacillus thiaminolyticus]MCY9601175.1 DNA uptake lipoprotein [Paenibacillus thiaminolyticus]MCY9605897.1 DNA uptake lipoprotein [Paenibacillus thiaminolyticus]MCY9611224.1 DNA uptake lipoprotein [Paenibacillus thiaminolyticus]MCY9617453.1 DNA uptake lipoprotein [Paenibacillus thiaminolyticus]
MTRAPITRMIHMVAVAAALGALLSGCSAQAGSVPPANSKTTSEAKTGPAEETPAAGKDKTQERTEIASNKDSSRPSSATGEEAEFNRKQPKLKGIGLTDTEEKVRQLWGAPVSQFVMDDDEPIHVLEYDGFSFGCHDNDEVVFVEVSGDSLSTGIKGLHIGGKSDTAVKSLGTPDQDTGYAWSYQAANALLRLDLDPKTGKIQSVKLFPMEESALKA